MLSRVADNLYWMSRYLERAEHTARLLDVHLPGMTGFEVLAQARVLNASLPAIIITAFDDDATRQTARLARVSAFFRKPFDNQALLQTIAECVAPRAST